MKNRNRVAVCLNVQFVSWFYIPPDLSGNHANHKNLSPTHAKPLICDFFKLKKKCGTWNGGIWNYEKHCNLQNYLAILWCKDWFFVFFLLSSCFGNYDFLSRICCKQPTYRATSCYNWSLLASLMILTRALYRLQHQWLLKTQILWREHLTPPNLVLFFLKSSPSLHLRGLNNWCNGIWVFFYQAFLELFQ